jgi:hypothetical protein
VAVELHHPKRRLESWMMHSVDAIGRRALADTSAPRTAGTQSSEESFIQHFSDSTGLASAKDGATASNSTPSADRQNSGDTRRNAVTSGQAPATGSTAADALGLIATPGAKATIGNQTFYGTSSGWSVTPNTAAAEAASTSVSKGEQMLGFKFEWAAKAESGTVNENAQPNGTVQLNPKLYATEDCAKKLAASLGATAVACESTTWAGGAVATQWELDFGEGRRLNAGLVADLFMRDPDRALGRLRAELA